MFLKSFDLHGFKSFKERTRLEFGGGITTIVGPNGSGKSNIADAFRWVLGEQKIRALRGVKGEDVIFGGTKVHKPLGVASVVMNINNHNKVLNVPYEEVSIGRKIYRSGESEYSINGISCRLKDIQELFNDTGLGKDSFSIIGQGEIDRILNAKPEDRRGMIEELAGIVKYRNRKDESLRKIEHAEINLRRVLDIIEELDGNFGNLEEDARKAIHYQSIKGKADGLELNLILNDIFDAEEELTKIVEELTNIKNANAKIGSSAQGKELLYEQNRLALLNLEDDLRENRIKLLTLKDVLGELRRDLITGENSIRSRTEKNQDIQYDLDEIMDRGVSLKSIYAEKLAQRDQWVALKKEKNQLIKELDGRLQSITTEKNNLLEVGGDIHYTLIDIFQEIAVLHNEIKSVEEEESSLKNREKNTLSEKEAIGLYKKDLGKILEEKSLENQTLRVSLDTFDQEIQGMENSKKSMEKIKEEKASTREELSHKHQEVYSKHKALLEIQKDYQGYYGGVKSVLMERDRGNLSGICGVIGELISVEKPLEKALETALGGSLQDIVVKRTDDAKEAITYLKKSEKGRATFLPLDAIKPRTLHRDQQQLLQEDGVVGLASELALIKDEYKTALNNLLGNVVIVEDLKAGAALAKKSGQSLKIVTLEGEQFMPGGALTGGNTGRHNSMLSRNRLVEELGKEAKGLKYSLNTIQEEIEELNQQLYPLEGKIEARKVKARETREYLITSNQDLGLRKQELENLDEKIALMEYNRENIEDEIRGLWKERILLKEKLVEKEEEKDRLEKVKMGKESEVKAKDLEIEEINDELLAEKLALNSLSEKEKAFDETLASYYAEQEDMKATLEKKQQVLEENTEFIEKEQIRMMEIQSTIQEKEKEYQQLDLLLQNTDGTRDRLNEENRGLEKELKENNRMLREGEEAQHTLEIREAKLETDLNNKAATLQEKFQLLTFEAMADRQPLEDKKASQRELRQLQNAIAELGTVNLGAIEEFSRVKERLTFLKEQEKDLRQSIDGLIEIIGDIDKIMTLRFTKSFEELNIAFGETYNALFGGGEAFIELTDKGDFLNSGIEIFSKPPGKTPKSLSTLSGGERALTALALLFSLLKINPSPMCIIDEADASLDERNVVNFANYLKNYSHKTQFVVISHRQGTIEESDNLYGVTMDKSGVSKIISVTLENKRRMEHA